MGMSHSTALRAAARVVRRDRRLQQSPTSAAEFDALAADAERQEGVSTHDGLKSITVTLRERVMTPADLNKLHKQHYARKDKA